MIEKLKQLCEIDGTSGDESRVRDYIISKLPEDVKFTVDNLGNLIVAKKGRQTPENKVMIAAHMDEVGFIVTDITAEGFLRFGAVGGIDSRVVLGRQVRFPNGIVGVIGTKAVHQQNEEERSKAPTFDQLLIDIGATDKEDAQKHIQIGDCACFVSEFFSFGDGFVKGKALDDRVGCEIMLEMLNSELAFDCTFVFTVQEEVGTRGARVAGFGVNPNYAIVLETTTACDFGGVEGAKKVCELGKGVVVSYMDRATLYNKNLYKLAFKLALENNIKCQTKTLVAGGNDSGAIHTSVGGVKTLALSLPCRYLHSPSCVIKQEDFTATAQLALLVFEQMCLLDGTENNSL